MIVSTLCLPYVQYLNCIIPGILSDKRIWYIMILYSAVSLVAGSDGVSCDKLATKFNKLKFWFELNVIWLQVRSHRI